MFLFKLSQDVNNDYDTYSSCVVVAKDPESAKAMVPYNPAFDDDDDDDYSYRTQAWAYIKEHGVSGGQTRKAMKASANQTAQTPHRE